MKTYLIRKNGEFKESRRAPEFVGVNPIKIFGKINCQAEQWYKENNRVYFHTIEDAALDGYKPCRICEPITEEMFERIKNLIKEKTIEEFYSRK